MIAPMLMLAVALFTGCADRAPLRPSENQLQGVGRLAVVVPAQSTFTVLNERTKLGGFGRMPAPMGVLDAAVILGLYAIVGVTQLASASAADAALTTAVAPHVAAISAPSVLGEAFVNALRASGSFGEIRMLDREPQGDELKRFDAVVLLKVPAWGLSRVTREEQELIAGFAKVHARLSMASSGDVVWEEEEDVFGRGWHALDFFKQDPELTRRELTEMLERAGWRFAAELTYPRGGKP
jgi:hypothetical protein